MKYPMLSNWLTYKEDKEVPYTYEVRHGLYGDYSFRLSAFELEFALKLNGRRDPYTIDPDLNREEVDILIQRLDSFDALRRSRVLYSEKGTRYKTVWIPTFSESGGIARAVNLLLMLLWLPVLLVGLISFLPSPPGIEPGIFEFLVSCAFSAYVSPMLHELGHCVAGLAYGCRVYEIGTFTENYVIPGAYASVESSRLCSPLKRVQVYAAGLEVNCLIMGASLWAATEIQSLSAMFVLIAAFESFYLIYNLTFVYKGTDGVCIIKALLGMPEDEYSIPAVKIVQNREKPSLGKSKSGVIALNVLFAALELLSPVVLIWQIAEVLLWCI